jgi:hypothetical protein
VCTPIGIEPFTTWQGYAQVAEAGRVLDLPLADYVVVGEGRDFNFRDGGFSKACTTEL